MSFLVTCIDDDPDFAEAIHKWAMNIGTLFTLVLRESLLSANDLTPSLKRISVSSEMRQYRIWTRYNLVIFPIK